MDINRALPIKSGFNFRELGGYKTKTGETIKYQKILRSSGLFRLSNEDLSFLSDYGVKNVVDFRSPEEKRSEPDKPIVGSENIFNPVFSVDETMNSGGSQDMIAVLSEEGSGENQMLWVYQDIVTNHHSNQAYRNFFDTLLGNTEDNKSVLFHCTAGKDRTGFGAAMFLSAVNVDEDIVIEDYLLSNKYLEGFARSKIKEIKEQGLPDSVVSKLYDLFMVKQSYIEVALDTIKKNSGSMDAYLEKVLWLDDKKRQKLADIYLTS